MHKRNITIFLLIVALAALVVTGCGDGQQVDEDNPVIQEFQRLDQIDFRAQNVVADKATSEELAREVYTEPQLSEALAYLSQMRRDKVKLVHYETDYKNIEILEQTDAEAKLRVHAYTRGTYYTSELPETKLGPLNHESKYEVRMVKNGEHWKIAEISYLPLEQQTAENTETGQ